MQDNVLTVTNLKKYFLMHDTALNMKKVYLRAVDGVSLHINRGETLGIVGESGCGKTTLARTIIRQCKATSGRIMFMGRDITSLSDRQLKPIRPSMQMVFQNPYSSLDPRMTAGETISEPLMINKAGTKPQISQKAGSLMDMVGLSKKHIDRYPHEFSGGQRQRIGIARALALEPTLVICDEPISSLDVSVKAQIINLLQDLQQELGLTYMFITHDLSMVKYISTRICVMYLGKIVEVAPSGELYSNPVHPYTKALLSAILTKDNSAGQRILLKGSVPSPINPPSGCCFRTRCAYAEDICAAQEPQVCSITDEHSVKCHFAERFAKK